MKLRLRRYFTFFSSSLRILPVMPFSRIDFLLRQTEALDQFNVAEGFCGRSRERRGFGDDGLLNFFDIAAEHRTDDAEQRHSQSEMRARSTSAPGRHRS